MKGDSYDARSDLWSIGAIIYQAVTAEVPFRAQSLELLKKKLFDPKGVPPITFPAGTPSDLMVSKYLSPCLSPFVIDIFILAGTLSISESRRLPLSMGLGSYTWAFSCGSKSAYLLLFIFSTSICETMSACSVTTSYSWVWCSIWRCTSNPEPYRINARRNGVNG